MNSTSKRAIAIQSVLGVIALAGTAAVAVLFARQPQLSQPSRPLPNPDQAAVILYSAGLAPDALAAAGLTGSQTTAALTRIRKQWPQLASQFDTAHTAYSAASIEHDRLERLIRSGTGTREDVAALEAARRQLQAATTQHDSAAQAFIQAADLGPEVTARLAALRDKHGEGLPTHYRVAVRRNADWLALRRALAAAEIHARLGEDVPEPARAVILANDGDAVVAAALVNIQANGSAVQTAWNQIVGQ